MKLKTIIVTTVSIMFTAAYFYRCFAQPAAARNYTIEGCGVLKISTKNPNSAPFLYTSCCKTPLVSLYSEYTYHICIKKEKKRYGVKCFKFVDSTVWINHERGLEFLSWENYFKELEKNFLRYKLAEGRGVRLSIQDTINYPIRNEPNDNANTIKCQFFAESCMIMNNIQGDWLEVAISPFDDCSESIYYSEKRKFPEKYLEENYEKDYLNVLASKCFERGWIRWKKGNKVYINEILDLHNLR